MKVTISGDLNRKQIDYILDIIQENKEVHLHIEEESDSSSTYYKEPSINYYEDFDELEKDEVELLKGSFYIFFLSNGQIASGQLLELYGDKAALIHGLDDKSYLVDLQKLDDIEPL